MTLLVPMTEPEFQQFRAEVIPAYAAAKVTSGEWAAERSLDLASQALAAIVPQGLATPDGQLFTLREQAGGAAIGRLCYNVREHAGHRVAYVYEVSVDPGHRRQGHASRALLALEAVVREHGLAGVALQVFGHNVSAQAMYHDLGYLPTSIQLYKPLG